MEHVMRRSRVSGIVRFCLLLLCTSVYLIGSPVVWSQVDADEGKATTELRTEGSFGIVSIPSVGAVVATDPSRSGVARAFVSLSLPAGIEKVFVDVAELVLTVSTVYDTTEPLLIAAFPATVSPESRSSMWSEDWTEMSGGFDPEFVGLASMCSTEDAIEIRLDVTAFVRRWVAGESPNYGIVLKTLSEVGKSTCRWIRDGRYDGGDAKLEIRYSRL